MLLEPAALLDEAHEGSDAGAGPDHDDWVGGLEGQAELGLADEHGHSGLVTVVRHQLVLQPVGGHALVHPARLGLVLHHHGADVNAVGVDLQQQQWRRNRWRRWRRSVSLGDRWVGGRGHSPVWATQRSLTLEEEAME